MQEPSIFTKIIRGEIPSNKIYEDDKTIAFLNINPTYPGHTLVVPKIQVDQYIDLPDEDYIALWTTVKKVASKLRDELRTDRVGVIVEGVEVHHAHVHLVPFNDDQPLRSAPKPTVAPDQTALAAMAERLHLS